MPDQRSRPQRKVAPGIIERHRRDCGYVPGRRRCTCIPAYRVQIKWTDGDGKASRITRTFPTFDEAQAWREASRANLARHGALAPPPSRRTAPFLEDAATDFLDRAENGKALTRARRPYAQSTIDSYESAFRLHVLTHLDERTAERMGDLPVDAIDARTIQAMVDALTVKKSAALARVADAAISALFADLYGRGIIDELLPRRALPPPPPARDERLTLAEVERLLVAAREYDEAKQLSLMEPLVAILVGGGLRIKEALNLTWGPDGVDLDATPPRLTVPRDTTKTDAGARILGLDSVTVAILKRHRLATGRPPVGALVFVRADGKAHTRSGRVRGGIKAVAEAAGVEPGFHLLRHTHGSLLADAGQGGHQIAARLGHRDAGFTARTYVHDASELSAAPKALDALRKKEAAKAKRAAARKKRRQGG